MTAYKEAFPCGTAVRIADLSALRSFRESWKQHHPLEEDQLAFAGGAAKVTNVSFYHGGDVLYQLDAAPGTWHETCLRPFTEPSAP